MKGNFDQCLALILRSEGGWVDDPRDRGGETNMGVTKKVWEEWVGHPVPAGSLKGLTVADVAPLYKANYWDKVRGDDLPDGVDYAVFDYAINSGVSRAVKQLQECCRVAVDGVIGPKTLAAAKAADPVALTRCICENRLAYLKSLSGWKFYGNGWGKRVADVSKTAQSMVG